MCWGEGRVWGMFVCSCKFTHACMGPGVCVHLYTFIYIYTWRCFCALLITLQWLQICWCDDLGVLNKLSACIRLVFSGHNVFIKWTPASRQSYRQVVHFFLLFPDHCTAASFLSLYTDHFFLKLTAFCKCDNLWSLPWLYISKQVDEQICALLEGNKPY